MKLSLFKKEPLTDQAYVREIQKRNDRVTEQFYNECKKYYNSAYRGIFTRMDIQEDIFQQSFVKLWTEIETGKISVDDQDRILRYDKRGDLRVLNCSLKTFLIDIAKFDYRDWIRSDRLTLEDDYEESARLAEIKSSVRDEEYSEPLEEQIIADCVMNLPPRCKEILTMFYYKDMSLDEIIAARGEKNTSKDGLKTGKYKCMETLKARVKEMYQKYHLKY